MADSDDEHMKIGDYEFDVSYTLHMSRNGQRIARWPDLDLYSFMKDDVSGNITWTECSPDDPIDRRVHYVTKDYMYIFGHATKIDYCTRGKLCDVDGALIWVEMELIAHDGAELHRVLPFAPMLESNSDVFFEESEARDYAEAREAEVLEYMREHHEEHAFFADDPNTVLIGFIRPDDDGRWQFTDGGVHVHQYFHQGGVAILYCHLLDEIRFRHVTSADMVQLYRDELSALDGVYALNFIEKVPL